MSSSTTSGHYERGCFLYEMGRYDAAIQEFTAALGLSAEDDASHHMLAYCFMLVKQYDAALDSAKHAIRISPQDSRYHFTLSKVHEVRNNHAEAREAIKEAIRLDPLVAVYHAQDAWLSAIENHYKEALKKADVAWRLDPQCEWSALVRALCLLELGKLAEAEEAASTLLQLNPQSAQAHWIMGHIKMGREKGLSALAHIRASMSIAPDSPFTSGSLAHVADTYGHKTYRDWLPKRPHPAEKQGYKVLRYGNSMKILLIIGAICFSVCAIGAYFFPGEEGIQWSVILSFVGLALFLFIPVICAQVSNVFWNDEEISGPDIWGRRRIFPWSEIIEIEYMEPLRSFKLTSENGASIWLSEAMLGYEDFVHKFGRERMRVDLLYGGKAATCPKEDGYNVMRHHKFIKIFTVVFCLVITVMAVGVMHDRYRAAGVILLALIALVQVFTFKVRWNDDTVEGRDFWGRKRQFRWSDLKNVKRTDGALVLKADKGREIYIFGTNLKLEGFQEFLLKLSAEADRLENSK